MKKFGFPSFDVQLNESEVISILQNSGFVHSSFKEYEADIRKYNRSPLKFAEFESIQVAALMYNLMEYVPSVFKNKNMTHKKFYIVSLSGGRLDIRIWGYR